MACKTDLTKVSHAGKLRSRYILFLSLLSILSSSSFHCLEFGFPFAKGAPKNLEGRCPSVNPNVLIILLFISPWVLKKKSWDLPLLMSNPLVCLNSSNDFLIALASLTDIMPISMVSSMNCWWIWGFWLLWGSSPFNSPLL